MGWVSRNTCSLGPRIVSQVSYSTTFPNTEIVISEGGKWENTVSATWNNPISTVGGSPGHAVGLGSSGVNDSVARLVGTYLRDQTVTATVFRNGSVGSAEIEVLLRVTMIPGGTDQILCYEMDIVPASNVVGVVKWLGNQGNVTSLVDWTGLPTLVDGDVFVFSCIGGAGNTVLSGTLNGVSLGTPFTDTSGYTTGNPGMGMDAGNPVDGANFGWKSYSAVTS